MANIPQFHIPFFLREQLCRILTGQGNENTLATLDYCESIGKRVWIRHVLVPGLTSEKSRLEKLAGYLSNFRCVERLELLPFHKMAAHKWQELNIPDPLENVQSPTPEEMHNARTLCSAHIQGKDVF